MNNSLHAKISPLINAQELMALKQTAPAVIIDARAGADAKSKYLAGHLEGAFVADLNHDLADIKQSPADGGRHPLPDPQKFSKFINSLGITADTRVVVYDDKNGSNAAARLWWMLRSAGHSNVQVLDGGFDDAVKVGFPVKAGEETKTVNSDYHTGNWQLPIANMNEVDNAVKEDGFVVIDVRDADRFRGEREPFDPVAGHIPGAVNIPFTSNLDIDGHYLPAGELRKKYLDALDGIESEHVIVHCGSGVTACHTILAMEHAGLGIPKLYVGSWSEWVGNNMPVATLNKKNE